MDVTSIQKVRPAKLEQIIDYVIFNNLNLCIVGQPGIGKTEIVEQRIIKSNNKGLWFTPAIMDVQHFSGYPVRDGDHASHIPFGNLYELCTVTGSATAVFDDFGQSIQQVQKACMPLFGTGKIDNFNIRKDISMILMTNRKEDLAGVSYILEPVKSRMDLIVELQPHVDDFISHAISIDQPIDIIGFAKWKPEIITNFEPSPEIKPTGCARTLVKLGNMIKAGIPKSIYNDIVYGCIGMKYGDDFLTFQRIMNELPDINMIIQNPDSYPISFDRMDILYAISIALSRKLNNANADNIFRFAKRLPKEFETFLVTAGIKYSPEIMKTIAYTSWLVNNSQFTMKEV